jgi:hypothetical protein
MINKHLVIRLVRHWHARIGVLAAIFFLFLAVTGVALNHTEQFTLAKIKISNPSLIHWYGLKTEVPEIGFITAHGTVVNVDGLSVLGAHRLPIADAQLIGVRDWQGMLVLASRKALYLINPEGQLVDTLTNEALPNQMIKNIGVYGQNLVINTSAGAYLTEDAIGWQPITEIADIENSVDWSSPVSLDKTYQQKLSEHFQPSLPLERVLLDVHSGRILGQYGPFIMDLVAILLMVLSISGVWIYIRSVRRNKKHL